MLAFEHGGGAFILASFLLYILMVYPLKMMETIIGQRYQLGGPQAFEKIKKGTSWIQWIPAFALMGVLFYYLPIFAWGTKYLVTSFSGAFLADPSNYFFSDILHITDSVTDAGSFQWQLLLGVLAGYAFTIYALRKNVLSLGPVVKITVTAPFVLLLILIIRGVSLPGAAGGLQTLFIPDWSALGDIKLWQAAMGQAFFSTNLAMGYYIISGSHRAKKGEIPKSSIWVLIGDFSTAILCATAIFSTIGFMAQQQGVAFADAVAGGPGLVFSVLPTAVSMMPWGIILFAALLFLIVITLAIDSIFGIVEIISGVFHDLWHKVKFTRVVLILCGVLTLGSLPYLMGSGLYRLDITDHYIGGFLLMIVGMFEAFVLAYIVGAEKIRTWINETSTGLKIGKWFNVILYSAPFILGGLVSISLYKETQEVYGGYPMEYIIWWGFVPLGLVLGLSIVFGVITHRKMKKHGLLAPLMDKLHGN
jgi:NSS family neurotransmitter:Na+ symporter